LEFQEGSLLMFDRYCAVLVTFLGNVGPGS